MRSKISHSNSTRVVCCRAKRVTATRRYGRRAMTCVSPKPWRCATTGVSLVLLGPVLPRHVLPRHSHLCPKSGHPYGTHPVRRKTKKTPPHYNVSYDVVSTSAVSSTLRMSAVFPRPLRRRPLSSRSRGRAVRCVCCAVGNCWHVIVSFECFRMLPLSTNPSPL